MKKILIVEDEVSSREGIRNLFDASLLPLQIETAADGYDGYEKALSFQPDIIISDIKMPRWTGITMVENLRKKDLQSRIIFLTGFAEFEYPQKAIQFGASDYVLKPVSYFVFSQRLNRAIERMKKREAKVIMVNIKGGMVRINIANIYYIESQGHTLILHTILFSVSFDLTVSDHR